MEPAGHELSHERRQDASADSLIDFMVERRLLPSDAAQRARAALLKSGQAVDTVLSELGLVGETALAEAQAAFLDLPLFVRQEVPDAPVALEGISPDFLQRAGLLPLAVDGSELIVATARPLERDAIRSLAFYLDRQLRIRIGAKSEIEAAFKDLYGDGLSAPAAPLGRSGEAAEDDVERLLDVAREAPIIRLVARLVSEAVEGNASDIHLEPTPDGLRVRIRIDGALRTTQTLDRGVIAGVITRIKILARLNIAERRLPQDGRTQMAIRGRDIDLRVSTVPTSHGESVVLRILDRGTIRLDFAALGFEPAQQASLRDLIGLPDGILLVTGPTGSGKTTSLYAALVELNREETKIFTVEDPIEYQLPGINQIQVKPGINLDFVACLRSILRQDPDIIMIGEIRDAETARIAVQSALTGHLVLSTLHTNSAASSITRLLDMGIEGYLLASTLRGIVAQRLVRRVCPSCAGQVRRLDAAASRASRGADAPGVAASRAAGCATCHGTGYSGRTTIAEILPMDPRLRELIVEHASEARIDAQARESGMQSLHQCGMAKVRAGETTVEEVFRVTGVAS